MWLDAAHDRIWVECILLVNNSISREKEIELSPMQDDFFEEAFREAI